MDASVDDDLRSATRLRELLHLTRRFRHLKDIEEPMRL